MRMLCFLTDLARAGGVEERAVTEGLPSVVARDGKLPAFIDWDDLIEALERVEQMLGGPEGVGRAARSVLPTAYPELRGFATVFVRPIPLFSFVMTRLNRANYRNMEVEVDRVGEDRVRWRQSIPDAYRASAAFHRITATLVEIFPCHLDLPEARLEVANITPRHGEFVAVFPPAPSLGAAGARALYSVTSVLAVQLEEAYARTGEALRQSLNGTSPGHVTRTSNAGDDWAIKLALSPRQREVFALVVEGRANKDIAATLACSERNVEFHVGRIFRAARVTSRAELLVKVLSTRSS